MYQANEKPQSIQKWHLQVIWGMEELAILPTTGAFLYVVVARHNSVAVEDRKLRWLMFITHLTFGLWLGLIQWHACFDMNYESAWNVSGWKRPCIYLLNRGRDGTKNLSRMAIWGGGWAWQQSSASVHRPVSLQSQNHHNYKHCGCFYPSISLSGLNFHSAQHKWGQLK